MSSSSWPTALIIFDIDGVVRDVSGSYRRAIADTVEHFTQGKYRPTSEEIDALKAEGCWNNDWEASKELVLRYFKEQGLQSNGIEVDYQMIVDFFQAKYRGDNFSGYIQNEPLLLDLPYLEGLTASGICWGFFSGATRASANYVLEKRLQLRQPVLIAMEDAPGKPDPAGLLESVLQLSKHHDFSWSPLQALGCPIVYVGDTVADMQTVLNAQQLYPDQHWTAIGVVPPHVTARTQYKQRLIQAGASQVLDSVQELSALVIAELAVK
jgi:HAD superfamily phosphatase